MKIFISLLLVKNNLDVLIYMQTQEQKRKVN